MLCRGPAGRGVGPLVAQGGRVGGDTPEEDELVGRGVVGHLGEAPARRGRRREGLGPLGPVEGPGVREGGVGVGEAPEENHLARRGVVGHGRVRARRGLGVRDHLDPGGAVVGPGVLEDVAAGVDPAEEDQLADGRVVGERGVRAPRGCERRALQGPAGAVEGPGVPESGDAVGGQSAEEDHLPDGRVVGHRGVAPPGWRGGGDLAPAAVVDPGVREGVGVDVESREDDQLAGRLVVGGGVVAPRRGAHRHPVGAVEGPEIREDVREVVETAEEDERGEGGVVGELGVRSRAGRGSRAQRAPGRAGEDPGVTEHGGAVGGQPPEEDELARGLVVGHRGVAPPRR